MTLPSLSHLKTCLKRFLSNAIGHFRRYVSHFRIWVSGLSRRQRYGFVAALTLVLITLGGSGWWALQSDESAKETKGAKRDGRPISVIAASVKQGDIEVLVDALGTVTALQTATVRPRVDGLLQRVLFKEGQRVKAGDVLAELDTRPFKIAVEQAKGQLLRDQAQLNNARIDLERYRSLLQKEAVSRQQLDTQAAQVQQFEGLVKLDQAQLDNALLQLDFAHIKAPLSGRLGLRQIDPGNLLKSSDTAGLVVLTQTQPITVMFALSEQDYPNVLQRWLKTLNGGEVLRVEVWSRDNQNRLARGKLMTIDNQLDSTTGTVRMKAIFENQDNALFPNQFVNVRVRLETLRDVVLAPAVAIQRSTQGTFVYLVQTVGNEEAVAMRPVKLGPTNAGEVVIQEGLAAGDRVVVDGLDKLRDGARIQLAEPKQAIKPSAKAKPAR